MCLSKWREFPSAPCLAGKNNLMAARVSMLLKSRAVKWTTAAFIPSKLVTVVTPEVLCNIDAFKETEALWTRINPHLT